MTGIDHTSLSVADFAAAKAFYAYLTGPKARDVFLDYGFSVAGTSAATN